MPIYEYRCQHCHRHFEILQKINDQPMDHCPECGGCLVRLVSSPAIQFRGSGWYITDYAHRNSPTGGNGQHLHEEDKKSEKSTGSDETPSEKK